MISLSRTVAQAKTMGSVRSGLGASGDCGTRAFPHRFGTFQRFTGLPLALAVAVSWSLTPTIVDAQDAEEEQPAVQDEQAMVPSRSLLLEPGEVQSLSVDSVERVVIGDPDIVDLTLVSSQEILLQGLTAGTTTLMLWDRHGQKGWHVQVVDNAPEIIEAQLHGLIEQLDLVGVQVSRKGGKIFLTGEVDNEDQLDKLDQLLDAYEGDLINLVTLPPFEEIVDPPLVTLQVKVVEMSYNDLNNLGIDWSNSVGFTEQSFAANPAGTVDINTALLDDGHSIAKRIGEPFRVGRLFRQGITATLNALVEDDQARLLAEPKLMTASGTEATSFIGVEVPVIEATSVGTGSGTVAAEIEFRETGVILTMTPTVQQEPTITLAIHAEVSEIDNSVGLTIPLGNNQTVLVPGFAVRRAATEIRTVSGETVIMAGLLEAKDSEDVEQVPGLGNLPMIGRLFRDPTYTSTQREVIITVTPEIVGYTPDAAVAAASPESGVEPDAARADAYADSETAESPIDQAAAIEEVLGPEPPTPEMAAQARHAYLRLVQKRIAEAVQYPIQEQRLGVSGQVQLRLHLFRNGVLNQAVVTQSSGVPAFDKEAIAAATTQAPYPAFPPALDFDDLWMELPILFQS